MSSVFKSPKVTYVQPAEVEVEPETVNTSELLFDIEKKRKKKMGAISQLLSHDNSLNSLVATKNDGNVYKKTLGG